jgi:hypothetical protein
MWEMPIVFPFDRLIEEVKNYATRRWNWTNGNGSYDRQRSRILCRLSYPRIYESHRR